MTTAFDVIEALVAAIKAGAGAHADATLHDLQATFGHPGRDLEKEGVIVGETIDDGERAPAALASIPAAVPIDERYTVDLRIEVVRDGGRAREAAERATGILETIVEPAVELVGGSQPPIVPALVTIELRRVQLRNAFSGEGRSSIYRCEVDVHARV